MSGCSSSFYNMSGCSNSSAGSHICGCSLYNTSGCSSCSGATSTHRIDVG